MRAVRWLVNLRVFNLMHMEGHPNGQTTREPTDKARQMPGGSSTVMSVRSVRVNGRALRQEMARRGLSPRDIAVSGKLSVLTVRSALASRRIAPRSLKIIAEALDRFPVLQVVDALLLDLNEDE
jgi:lambda repressor-like predicted transcriptional regulator